MGVPPSARAPTTASTGLVGRLRCCRALPLARSFMPSFALWPAAPLRGLLPAAPSCSSFRLAHRYVARSFLYRSSCSAAVQHGSMTSQRQYNRSVAAGQRQAGRAGVAPGQAAQAWRPLLYAARLRLAGVRCAAHVALHNQPEHGEVHIHQLACKRRPALRLLRAPAPRPRAGQAGGASGGWTLDATPCCQALAAHAAEWSVQGRVHGRQGERGLVGSEGRQHGVFSASTGKPGQHP